MALSIEEADARLLDELVAALDDTALTEAEYRDPEEFASALLNNLPAIAYALHAGMPVTAWRPARKNPGEEQRILRAMRQWGEQARRLISSYIRGEMTDDDFRARIIALYQQHARNSYVAGRRSVGDLAPTPTKAENLLNAIATGDAQRVADLLGPQGQQQIAAGGGLLAMLKAMFSPSAIFTPSNYLGSGLPGDPFANLPPPLGAGGGHKKVKPGTVVKAGDTIADPGLEAGLAADERALAADGVAEALQIVDTAGDTIGTYSHAGELAALTEAVPAKAVLTWWVLGAADHCIDCVRMSEMSPFFASKLSETGMYPGSGHTRCGRHCQCTLTHDVPAEVCTDPMSGPGTLGYVGDLTGITEADGRLNVWVQEGQTCAQPISIDALAGKIGIEAGLDDTAAFSWDQDVADAIKGDLGAAVPFALAPADLQAAFGFLREIVPGGRLDDLRLTRYELDGTVYHAAWQQTGDAIRFEFGATTKGVGVFDSDLTLRAMHDLSDLADRSGLRFEVNGASTNAGMDRWLDAAGASRMRAGGALPTATPDFAQQRALADRATPRAPFSAPDVLPTVQPTLDDYEVVALEDYLISYPQNALLRRGDALNQWRNLDGIIARTPAIEQDVLWRSIDPETVKTIRASTEWTDAAYWSTAKTREQAAIYNPGGMVRIEIPAGSQGIDVDLIRERLSLQNMRDWPDTGEVILPRGSRFAVRTEGDETVLTLLRPGEVVPKAGIAPGVAARPGLDSAIARVEAVKPYTPGVGIVSTTAPTWGEAFHNLKLESRPFVRFEQATNKIIETPKPQALLDAIADPQHGPANGYRRFEMVGTNKAGDALGKKKSLQFVAYDADGNAVASLSVWPSDKEIGGIVTRPDALKQGWATALYDHVQDAELNLYPLVGADKMTADGKAFVSKWLEHRKMIEAPRAGIAPAGALSAERTTWDNPKAMLADLQARHPGIELDPDLLKINPAALIEGMGEFDRLQNFFRADMSRIRTEVGSGTSLAHAGINVPSKDQKGWIVIHRNREPWKSFGKVPGRTDYAAGGNGPAAIIRHEYGHVILGTLRTRATPEQLARLNEIKNVFYKEPYRLSPYAAQGVMPNELTAEWFAAAMAPTMPTDPLLIETRQLLIDALGPSDAKAGIGPKGIQPDITDAGRPPAPVVAPTILPTPTFMPAEVDALPAWPDMGLLKQTSISAAGEAGWAVLGVGANPKKLLHDPSGREWLFKVGGAENPDADVAATAIAHRMGLRVPPTQKATWENKTGTLQAILPDATSLDKLTPLGKTAVEIVDDAGLREIAHEAVLDFVLANADTHGANWIQSGGHLWGVDKGRSFGGAVIASQNAKWFFSGGMGTLIRDAVELPHRSRIFERLRPADFATVLNRLDGISAAEFEALSRPALASIANPLGTIEQSLEVLLARKTNARSAFEAWLTDAVAAAEKAGPIDGMPTVVSPEWKAWAKAGGHFDVAPVAPAEQPTRLLQAPAQAKQPPPEMRSSATHDSRVGNDLGILPDNFIPSTNMPDALARLGKALPKTSGNVTGGFSLGQINMIVARAESMAAQGVDMSQIVRLGDFTLVPKADQARGIGLTYKGDRIALNHDHRWAYLNGIDAPETVYNDIGGLFAHEYGHVLFAHLGAEQQSKMLALAKANVGTAGKDLSTYAASDAEEWFGEVVAQITTPGYVPGTLAYDEQVWTAIVSAGGGKAVAKADKAPGLLAHAPKVEPAPVITDPIWPSVTAPKEAHFKVGDAQTYLLPDSPLPVNAPHAQWSGYVPPEPGLPSVATTPEIRAAARAAHDAAIKDWQEVASGKVAAAFTWSKKDADAAKAAGLVVEKIGDHYVAGSGPEALQHLQAFVAGGGSSNDDAFWHLLGYSDADLAAYDAWFKIDKEGLRLTAGVVIAEPDGRLWMIAPRNKYAGYDNTWIKGGVDAGETAAQAAIREVMEESGLSVELDHYLGDYVNTDKTGVARMYIGHRSGGGPLWAHAKETYEVRLVDPADATAMLTRYGKPDQRDQQILTDAVTALQGKPGLPQAVITDPAELAAKTAALDPAQVWWPESKAPKAGPAPLQPLSTTFGYDHTILANYTPAEIPPAAKFPYNQTRWTMANGEVQPMFWQVVPGKAVAAEVVPLAAEPFAAPTWAHLEKAGFAYKDKINGIEYIVKGTSGDTGREARIAADLQRHLGVHTPEITTLTGAGAGKYAQRVVPGTELTDLGATEIAAVNALSPKQAADLTRAEIANWLTGEADDNIGNFVIDTKAGGRVWTVDHSESLKATGAEIPFLPEPLADYEGGAPLTSLATAGSLLMKVTPADVAPMIRTIAHMTDAEIADLAKGATSAELAGLIARRDAAIENWSKYFAQRVADMGDALGNYAPKVWQDWIKAGATFSDGKASTPGYLFWANSKKGVADPQLRLSLHVAQIAKHADTLAAQGLTLLRVNETLLDGTPGLRDLLIAAGGKSINGKWVDIGSSEVQALATAIKANTPLPNGIASIPASSLAPTPQIVGIAGTSPDIVGEFLQGASYASPPVIKAQAYQTIDFPLGVQIQWAPGIDSAGATSYIVVKGPGPNALPPGQRDALLVATLAHLHAVIEANPNLQAVRLLKSTWGDLSHLTLLGNDLGLGVNPISGDYAVLASGVAKVADTATLQMAAAGYAPDMLKFTPAPPALATTTAGQVSAGVWDPGDLANAVPHAHTIGPWDQGAWQTDWTANGGKSEAIFYVGPSIEWNELGAKPASMTTLEFRALMVQQITHFADLASLTPDVTQLQIGGVARARLSQPLRERLVQYGAIEDNVYLTISRENLIAFADAVRSEAPALIPDMAGTTLWDIADYNQTVTILAANTPYPSAVLHLGSAIGLRWTSPPGAVMAGVEVSLARVAQLGEKAAGLGGVEFLAIDGSVNAEIRKILLNRGATDKAGMLVIGREDLLKLTDEIKAGPATAIPSAYSPPNVAAASKAAVAAPGPVVPKAGDVLMPGSGNGWTVVAVNPDGTYSLTAPSGALYEKQDLTSGAFGGWTVNGQPIAAPKPTLPVSAAVPAPAAVAATVAPIAAGASNALLDALAGATDTKITVGGIPLVKTNAPGMGTYEWRRLGNDLELHDLLGDDALTVAIVHMGKVADGAPKITNLRLKAKAHLTADQQTLLSAAGAKTAASGTITLTREQLLALRDQLVADAKSAATVAVPPPATILPGLGVDAAQAGALQATIIPQKQGFTKTEYLHATWAQPVAIRTRSLSDTIAWVNTSGGDASDRLSAAMRHLAALGDQMEGNAALKQIRFEAMGQWPPSFATFLEAHGAYSVGGPGGAELWFLKRDDVIAIRDLTQPEMGHAPAAAAIAAIPAPAPVSFVESMNVPHADVKALTGYLGNGTWPTVEKIYSNGAKSYYEVTGAGATLNGVTHDTSVGARRAGTLRAIRDLAAFVEDGTFPQLTLMPAVFTGPWGAGLKDALMAAGATGPASDILVLDKAMAAAVRDAIDGNTAIVPIAFAQPPPVTAANSGAKLSTQLGYSKTTLDNTGLHFATDDLGGSGLYGEITVTVDGAVDPYYVSFNKLNGHALSIEPQIGLGLTVADQTVGLLYALEHVSAAMQLGNVTQDMVILGGAIPQPIHDLLASHGYAATGNISITKDELADIVNSVEADIAAGPAIMGSAAALPPLPTPPLTEVTLASGDVIAVGDTVAGQMGAFEYTVLSIEPDGTFTIAGDNGVPISNLVPNSSSLTKVLPPAPVPIPVALHVPSMPAKYGFDAKKLDLFTEGGLHPAVVTPQAQGFVRVEWPGYATVKYRASSTTLTLTAAEKGFTANEAFIATIRHFDDVAAATPTIKQVRFAKDQIPGGGASQMAHLLTDEGKAALSLDGNYWVVDRADLQTLRKAIDDDLAGTGALPAIAQTLPTSATPGGLAVGDKVKITSAGTHGDELTVTGFQPDGKVTLAFSDGTPSIPLSPQHLTKQGGPVSGIGIPPTAAQLTNADNPNTYGLQVGNVLKNPGGATLTVTMVHPNGDFDLLSSTGMQIEHMLPGSTNLTLVVGAVGTVPAAVAPPPKFWAKYGVDEAKLAQYETAAQSWSPWQKQYSTLYKDASVTPPMSAYGYPQSTVSGAPSPNVRVHGRKQKVRWTIETITYGDEAQQRAALYHHLHLMVNASNGSTPIFVADSVLAQHKGFARLLGDAGATHKDFAVFGQGLDLDKKAVAKLKAQMDAAAGASPIAAPAAIGKVGQPVHPATIAIGDVVVNPHSGQVYSVENVLSQYADTIATVMDANGNFVDMDAAEMALNGYTYGAPPPVAPPAPVPVHVAPPAPPPPPVAVVPTGPIGAAPTGAAGVITGPTTAPAAVTPAFLYGFDPSLTATPSAHLGTADYGTGQVAGPKEVWAHGAVKGYWNPSPTGSRSGLFGLEWTSGTDPADVRAAAFALLREAAEDGANRAKGFFVKPEFYDKVEGLRQIILDAGGNEANWSSLGIAVQMDAAAAQKLADALKTNTMGPIKPGFQSTAQYLGYDVTTLKATANSVPYVDTNGVFSWAVGTSATKPTVTVQATAEYAEATMWAITGDAVQKPVVAAAQIGFFAEQGTRELRVSKAVLDEVNGLRQWLLGVGGRVDGGVIVMDEASLNLAGRLLAKDVLPVPLGGKALPFSVFDSLSANVDDAVKAIGSHATEASGPLTHSTFTLAGSQIKTSYARSGANVFWQSIDRGTASVGQARAATAAQMRAFAMLIGQNTSMERLDIGETVLAAQPGLRAVLKKYGAQEVKATGGQPAYLSLPRTGVLKMRKDIEGEFTQLGHSTSAANGSTYITQQAALIDWPVTDDLTYSLANTQALVGAKTNMGGAVDAMKKLAIYKDASGNEWLFKPGASGRGAATDAAVSEVAALIGLPVPPTRIYTLTFNGQPVQGSLQKIIPGAKAPKAIADLTPTQTEDLLRHSVLDWLTNNDDGHAANYLMHPDGHLWSIDKSRSYQTWGSSTDRLFTDNPGNGVPPLIFEYFRKVRQDPKALSAIHPQTIATTLRALKDLPDARFRQIMKPVAEAHKGVGKEAERFLDAMVARKQSTAADFETYFKGEIDAALKAKPASVPPEWKAWAAAGGHFNLKATPRDLWQEDLAALRAKFLPTGTAWSPSAYRDVISKTHLRPAKQILDEFVGPGLSSYAGRDVRVAGIAPEGTYSAHYIPRLIDPKLYEEWSEIQRWATLEILNGGAPVKNANKVAEARRFWNPDTGKIRLVRGSRRFRTVREAYEQWQKDGIRPAFSTSHTRPPWGDYYIYLDLDYSQVLTSQFTDISSGGENEFTVRDIRADQIYHISKTLMSPSEQVQYQGPVL